MSDNQNAFYARATELIKLANQQNQNTEIQTGEVSASFMWALARYNAWFGSTSFENKEQMQAKKQEMMDYYMERYKEMLDANLEDYIENFDHYRATQK
ncbi:DUF3144 domain-containing protein [Shewanella xiamenensis]|jgi:TRAP-type uncharacterized transport system substrate-binding protein|uniref:DUF3144 domain-containing protein n=1 Tax=Shewanella xiamenensis TaxID=332186 RepID=A0A1E3USD8_9GAMM|nr:MULTISPECIES: DUF3144 domain-containing protein [Shewanella]PZP32186.1 MAG: DUF3144 domain-containing protein [Shewanella oneidensis]ASF15509.1 DUF3144 domain-containing protein [Shewanella sp. FDAARGOS_354]KPN78258.1 hypothetical protein AEA42_03800 [Shewanella sp. Sh95]MBW0278368.1 hypothetical protein [Shewanella xiamenensis]MBW0295199.1 hypothetical protein [Shewanella xiamenensis]